MQVLTAKCAKPPGKGQLFRSVKWLNIIRFLQNISQCCTNLARSLQGMFLGCALIAERIRKGDILAADTEKLENGTRQ